MYLIDIHSCKKEALKFHVCCAMSLSFGVIICCKGKLNLPLIYHHFLT
ncbi:hypothetical protein ZEAMMB73_Zm00001d048107 [Zea mays]|uniref:Uncharacterized protein n=1 Tax=Zea mays TaxID=4577 RepID=A0A1D6PHJ9_MAIZE|nr:hypothetical protein ZEAMMB73_Zm00001d048107 [Zea mays]